MVAVLPGVAAELLALLEAIWYMAISWLVGETAPVADSGNGDSR